MGNYSKLCFHHEPLAHKVLQVQLRDLRQGLTPLHCLEEKKKQRPVSSTTFSPVSRSISQPLFLFSHREGGEEATGIRVRRRRFAQERSRTL
jgi:hypothetical protein